VSARTASTVTRVIGEDLDVGRAYRGARERLTELFRSGPETAFDVPVPHLPGWTARETLAHLVGVVDDATHRNLDGVATDPWTAAQVAKRADATVGQMLDEWSASAPSFEQFLSARGLALAQPVFDIASHEHDLRFALSAPGGRDSDAVAVGVHFIATWLSRRMTEGLIAPLQIVIGSEQLFPGIDDGAAELRATAFDVLRVFGSRRTEAQIAALDWSGPVPPVAWCAPFALPTLDLDEG
jgi:uncharacterized protein (TIGR03083 family)